MLKDYFSILSDVSYFLLLKFYVCKETFHKYLQIFKGLQGENATNYTFMWRSKPYLFTLKAVCKSFRSSHWCWMCCTKKLFSTCEVKILEKYLWWCTFFSKVACWRPETLLKLTSFIGNLKGFCPQIHRKAANFRKAFWRALFCWTLRTAFFCL